MSNVITGSGNLVSSNASLSGIGELKKAIMNSDKFPDHVKDNICEVFEENTITKIQDIIDIEWVDSLIEYVPTIIDIAKNLL